MFRLSATFCLGAGLFLLSVARLRALEAAPEAETFCHDWFGKQAQTRLLALANTNVVVSAVTENGHTSGWIFRTDQVPPACKGKRGQIAVLVAVGTDARIKGVSVLAHREDAPYFKRLKRPFFDQFKERSPNDEPSRIDAVTHATLSSRAIIRDVLEGTKAVLAQPEVAAQLKSPNKGG